MSDVPSGATPSSQTSAPQTQPQAKPQTLFSQGNNVPHGTQAPTEAPPPVEIPKYGFDDEIETNVMGQKRKVPLKKMVSDYQKYETADHRLREAAETRKDLETRNFKLTQALAEIKKNPALFLQEALGSEDAIDQFSEDRIWQKIQNDKKSPELREAEKFKQLYENEQRTKQQEAKQRESYETQKKVEAYRQHYDQFFSDALQGSGLPKTPETVERMSKIMQSSIQNGYELTKQELVEAVESSFTGEINSLFSKLPIEKILKFLGDDLSRKIREYDIAKLQSPNGQQQQRPATLFNPQANLNVSDHDAKMPMKDAKQMWRQRAGLSKY